MGSIAGMLVYLGVPLSILLVGMRASDIKEEQERMIEEIANEKYKRNEQ